MHSSITQIFKWQTLLSLLIVFSCDTFKQDRPFEEGVQTQTDYYTTPTLAIVIDLSTLMTKSFETTAVSIVERPGKGSIFELNYKTYTYRPWDSFTEGEDQLIVIQSANGREIARHIVNIHVLPPEELPCALIPVEDKHEIQKGQQIIISVLDNDVFCDPSSTAIVSIDLEPQRGTATLVQNEIVYTPGPDFSTLDRFTYRISTASGDALGLVTLLSPGTRVPDESPTEPHPINNNDPNIYAIEFLNEMIGFKAGPGIFKTTDGGVSWRKVLGEINGGTRSFVDVQFINDMEGFAIYTGKECYDTNGCENGLALTKDGGETWHGIPMNNRLYLTDMHFLTSSSGLIAGSTGAWAGDNQIYETTDGGNTWNRVLSQEQDWFYWIDMKLGFADDQFGYAVQQDIIFETTDAGHTWTNRIDYGGAMFSGYATYNRDTLFASRRVDRESYLYRYVNEQPETRVAILPGYISLLAFTPSKRTGHGLGVEYTSDSEGYLLFYHSQDRGNTWTVAHRTLVPVDVYAGVDIAAPTDNVVYMLYNNVIYKQTY